MRFAHKTLDEVTKLVAGETATIKLPRDRFIRDVLLYVTLKIKNGGSSDVAVTESQILSLLKRIRVVASGQVNYMDVNGYRKFIMCMYDFNTKPYVSIPSTIPAGSSRTFEIELPLIFAANPVNEWDVLAVIPAHLTSSLYCYIDMGDPADINSNLSLESGQVEVTVKEVYCSKDEHDKILKDLMVLKEVEVSKAIDTAYSDYQFKVDLDVGCIIQKLGIFAYDTNNNLSDSVISAYQIKQDSPLDVILEKITWKQSRAEDKRVYDMETLPTGVTIWDAEFKLGGLDTRGLKSGDIKFKANTKTTGSVVLYHRELAPARW